VTGVPVAADYPFLDLIWTMILFFLWVAWIWVLISIIGDIFRRHDINGLSKTLWVLFVIFLPFLGVLIYILVNGDDMAKRNVREAQAAQANFDDYVRSVAGSSTDQIAKAKELLDAGTITQAEFDQIKAKALA
jgi:hypothetical protein